MVLLNNNLFCVSDISLDLLDFLFSQSILPLVLDLGLFVLGFAIVSSALIVTVFYTGKKILTEGGKALGAGSLAAIGKYATDRVIESLTNSGDSSTGNSPSNTGDSPSNTGDSPSNTGDSSSNSGDSPSNTGDSSSNTGGGNSTSGS